MKQKTDLGAEHELVGELLVEATDGALDEVEAVVVPVQPHPRHVARRLGVFEHLNFGRRTTQTV